METKNGIVVKLTKNQIVLLMPDGSFKNIKRSFGQTPLIGERITLDAGGVSNPKYPLAALAAVICLVLIASFRFGALLPETSKVAYVFALDINPSIEIQTDKGLKVLGIEMLNEDAKKVIGGTQFINADLLIALDDIIKRCIVDGYLNQDEKGFIKITVVPIEENKFAYKDERNMKEMLQEHLRVKSIEADVEIDISSIDMLNNAHQNSLSVNRYILYKDLKEKGADISIEEVQKISLREFDSLQKNITGKNIQEMKKTDGNRNEAGTFEIPSNIKENSINDTAATANSGSNGTSNKSNGNISKGKEGTTKGDGKTDSMSIITSDDKASKESKNADIGENGKVKGTEGITIGGKPIDDVNSNGTGKNSVPEQPINEVDSDKGIEQSQKFIDKNSNGFDKIGGDADKGRVNSDSPNSSSTGSVNKRGK